MMTETTCKRHRDQQGGTVQIRKLTTPEELYESERILATAFLHPWDEEEARNKSEALLHHPATGEERWGLWDDADQMVASVSTMSHTLAFGGQLVSAGEVHMVGSLPEDRGGGNVRALMASILQDFRARGDAFALLIPFSFAFYRKFGFELAARTYTQRVPIEQLAGMACDYRVTRVESERDVPVVRSLYESFARARNMADLLNEDAWKYAGNGEFGERDFLHLDDIRYTYVLWDHTDKPCAYVRFIFHTAPQNPFMGELKVCDCAYDNPQAFRGILGFLHRMRAKVSHVSFELMDEVDLATVLPECGDVECTMGGHVMARLLDVPRALELMPHPQTEGSYTLGVTDAFMPQNDARYRVSYFGGYAVQVTRTDAAPDLQVSEETLCQLIVGRIGLEDARYREGTIVATNADTLTSVFVRRPISLAL